MTHVCMVYGVWCGVQARRRVPSSSCSTSQVRQMRQALCNMCFVSRGLMHTVLTLINNKKRM